MPATMVITVMLTILRGQLKSHGIYGREQDDKRSKNRQNKALDEHTHLPLATPYASRREIVA